jgi:hypothetical protein
VFSILVGKMFGFTLETLACGFLSSVVVSGASAVGAHGQRLTAVRASGKAGVAQSRRR